MEDTFSVVGEDLAEKGTFGQRPEVREGDVWGELGLGGPLGLELLDGVECLVESESGCEDEGDGMESGALGMRSAGCAPRPDAGAHGAGVATAPLTPRAHAGAYACW